jgi:hypothetical protein
LNDFAKRGSIRHNSMSGMRANYPGVMLSVIVKTLAGEPRRNNKRERVIMSEKPDGIERTGNTLARQTMFALALAKGLNTREAAKQAGIAESTGYRWSGERNVAEMVNTYRLQIVRETVGKLSDLGTIAVARLSELVRSSDEAIALKASVAVLSEVRRVADANEGKCYAYAWPMPPAKPVEPGDEEEEVSFANLFLDFHPDDFGPNSEAKREFRQAQQQFETHLAFVEAQAVASEL